MITTDEDYALFCTQKLADPSPLLARLRAQDPIHWSPTMNMWLVTRYDDVYSALHDTTRLSSSREGMYTDPLTESNRRRASRIINHILHWLENVDAPQHTRLRKLVNLAFTPRMLHVLISRIEAITNELLDEVCATSRTDFAQSFCFHLPATVICEILGVPAEHREMFGRCVDQMRRFNTGVGPGLNDAIDEANQGFETLIGFFHDLIEQRRQQPRDDLISAMAAAEDDGDRLNRDEMFGLCVFLFAAGHEPTMSLLSCGTLALLQNPDQFKKLKVDPDGLVDTAIEELLRYGSPATRGVRRATCDFEWRGRRIRKGQTVTLLLGAANRDPDQFPDPDRLDIQRTPNKHLAFGFGPHFCLGAQLTRMEGNIAFRAIARRLPDMRLDTDRIEYHPVFGVRVLTALPIRTGRSPQTPQVS